MIVGIGIAIGVVLAGSGCGSLPGQDSAGHPLRHSADLEALHSVRGGKAPVIPHLKWVDVTSVVAEGAGSIPLRSRLVLQVELWVGTRRVQWEVRASHEGALREKDWKRRLEFATRYLAELGALGSDGLVLELELVPKGIRIDATERAFYFRRPELRFHLPFDNGPEQDKESLSAMASLATVVHELVHFQLLSVPEARLLDEETIASSAEQCFFIEGMLREEGVDAVRVPASIMLQDRESG